MRRFAPTCRGGYGLRQILGDSKTNCTIHNNRLDEEDIDADNVLNLTTAERDQEKWQRYVVNLADPSKRRRTGVCSAPPQLAGQPRGPRHHVCCGIVRHPTRTPADTPGQALP